MSYGGYQVPEIAGPTRVVTRRFIRDAHKAGLKVQVWTVDEVPDATRLLEWGVDGLISNRPDVAIEARNLLLVKTAKVSEETASREKRGHER